MQSGLGHNGRLTASATFYGLVLLTIGLLAALSGFASYIAPVYNTCKSVWDNLLLRASSISVLFPIVVSGSVVMVTGLSLVRQWRATRRLLRGLASYQVRIPSRVARIAEEVGLADRIDCVSDATITPFCYGFVQPRVCFPIALLEVLDDDELRAVLRHEGGHARRHDPLKIWLSRALARGLCFLPLAGDLRDSYMTAKEVAADEITSQTEGLALASALVKMLSADWPGLTSATGALDPVDMPAAALGEVTVAGLISVTRETSNQTEERIRCLIDGRPIRLELPSISSVVLSALIIAAIFGVSHTNARAASEMLASHECVPENLLREHAHDLTIEWSNFSAEMEAMPTRHTVDVPSSMLNQLHCDLLISSCQHRDQISATTEFLSTGY